ncbi:MULTISPECIES: TonB-dependent receptor [unclassified Fusobacterium]|uniref:TonB-dependent receptor n=1 Tax=unclassified Fusobacterium TaxID=2648384 RepID=UPI001B8DA6EF|nr:MULTISPECIES: TonB-dependent receptor [unclassified Fusobacterium]MBR8700827.1 Vitamin B12 transporter BtuB [Fusobacterium sp. DD45]MBR8710634.1 Vitamin B12 transporter BtuB [Fusobacterium sp. DD28]MBR8751177.1 Vitamin B12 transporter BtuB [Fusobacterium sp. DD26]
MKTRVGILSFIICATAFASGNTIELGKSVIQNKSYNREFIKVPKMSKNTYTVTQEQIREKNYKNVEDVLRDAPGVIVQNTAFGPKVDMRGNGEKSISKVKVMVDGISINPTEEAMASLPINSIPIESIKKVEIIPGGGATLYGSGSVGGVVNIITNSNVTKDNFFMDMKYGSYDNRSFGFAGGNNISDKLYVNYGFNYINSEGYRESDDTQDTLYLLGFDYKFNKNNKIRFQGRNGKQKFDSTTEVSHTELEQNRRAKGLNMDTDQKNESYTLDFEHRFNNNFSMGITGYNQTQKRDLKADSIDDIIITVKLLGTDPIRIKRFRNIPSVLTGKFKETKDGIKLKGNYASDNFDTIFGYDYLKASNKRKSYIQSAILKNYTDENGSGTLHGRRGAKDEPKPIISNVDIDLTKSVHSLYAFNKYKVNENLDLTFGARGELTTYKGYRKNGPNSGPYMGVKNQKSETDRSMKDYAGEVGSMYRYNDTGSVFVRYERGFVTPFASQLTDKVHDNLLEKADSRDTGMRPQLNVASKYVANNLKSEKTDTVEIGMRDYILDSFVSLSLYATDTTGEITTISSGVTNPAVQRWKYRNIGKTRRMGVELEAEQMFDKLSLSQSLSYVNAKVIKGASEYNIEKGDKIPMVPAYKLTLGGKYQFTDKVSLVSSYTYVSKKSLRELDESDPTPEGEVKETINKYTIKGYGTLDAGLLYKIDDYATLKFGVKNLLDKKYNLRETSKVAVPAPSRNYYLELNVKF